MTGVYVLHSKLEYVKLFVLYRDVKFTITVKSNLGSNCSCLCYSRFGRFRSFAAGGTKFCLYVVEAYLFD